MDEDVVHLHLEHRVVQRLLGRFIAQGFVYHDLSRACLAQTSDAIPRVILLGAVPLRPRRCPVARGVDPGHGPLDRSQIRKAQLAPYGREAESKTLDLLEEALLLKTGRSVTETVLKQLQASAPAMYRNCCRT